MVPRRPPRPCRWTAPLSGRCHDAAPPWLTVDPVPDRKPPGVGSIEIAAGLAWIHNRAHRCPPYIPYYNMAAVLTCTASGRGDGIWYVLEALRRCDTLQHCTGDIIAACVGLVFAAGEWGKRQKKHL